MVRSIARRFGIDIRRFPGPDDLAFYLARHRIAGALDVGGNVGQTGLLLRSLGFRGQIVSVEPLPEAFQKLRAAAAADGNWTAHHLGLGDAAGELPLNVGTATTFSSFLAPTAHVNAINEHSTVSRQVIVPIRRMDEAWGDFHISDADPLLLKIDTQGYELPVLRGAGERLRTFSLLQIEMSIRPIYQGQPPFHEVIAYLRTNGFALTSLIRGYAGGETDELLEMDGIFVREP